MSGRFLTMRGQMLAGNSNLSSAATIPTTGIPCRPWGPGAREIRIREASGAFRVIYPAVVEDRVLVLHAFRKKTQTTSRKDLDLATRRLKRWKAER